MEQENVAAINIQNGGAENGSSNAVRFSALKPQLVVEAPKAADAVQFYKSAFGAEEVKRSMHPKRKADQELPLILCAELKLGSSVFLLCDQTEESPATKDCVFCLETEDVDGAVSKAVNAGAEMEGEITEGDGACGVGRCVGKLKDPYGFIWLVCSPGKKCADVDA